MSGLFGPQSANAVFNPVTSVAQKRYTGQTWVKDGSSPNANDGTILDAAFFNRIIGALEYFVNSSGITAALGDATVLWRAMQQAIAKVMPGYLASYLSIAATNYTPTQQAQGRANLGLAQVASSGKYTDLTGFTRINAGTGLIGGGALGTDITLTVDGNAMDYRYALAATAISGGGLAVATGTLGASPKVTVTAATNSDATTGSRTDVVITPASLQAALNQLATQIIGAAPTTLDTLQEIAAALGSDPNFATTMTTSLAGKVPTTRTITTTSPLQGGGALSGNLTLTFNQAWSDGIYAKLTTTVTGTGLATGGGALSANQAINVLAASNSDANTGTATDRAVTPAALKYAFNQWIAGYVPTTVTVTGTGLATGGGALSANQAINVLAASNSDAITGTATDRAVTPAALAAALTNFKSTLPRDLIFVIDGGGSAITTGLKGYITVDFPCTINMNTLLGDQSGSIVIDLWKTNYASFDAGATHPVAADSICASAKPTITTATKSQDSTLTGWTKTLAAGDILGVYVSSVSTLTRVTLALKATPS